MTRPLFLFTIFRHFADGLMSKSNINDRLHNEPDQYFVSFVRSVALLLFSLCFRCQRIVPTEMYYEVAGKTAIDFIE